MDSLQNSGLSGLPQILPPHRLPQYRNNAQPPASLSFLHRFIYLSPLRTPYLTSSCFSAAPLIVQHSYFSYFFSFSSFTIFSLSYLSLLCLQSLLGREAPNFQVSFVMLKFIPVLWSF